MSRNAIAMVVLFFTLFVTGHGRTQSNPPSDGDSQLAQLAWLVGTWRGEGKAPDGKPATNEFRFEWAPNKKAFRYVIDRTSDGITVPALVGLCAWHPAKRQLVLWEVSGEGAITESTLRIGGGKHSYDEVIYGADGSKLPVRAEAVRQGDDAFNFKASVEQRGEWKVVFETTWRRVKR